ARGTAARRSPAVDDAERGDDAAYRRRQPAPPRSQPRSVLPEHRALPRGQAAGGHHRQAGGLLMPRLPNLTKRDDVPEPLLEAYDRVAAARQGTVSGPYGILLHSPELAHRAAVLGEYTRWNSVLSDRQTETAVLAVAREMDANVMWA